MQNYFYDLHDQLVKAEIFKKDGTKETWAYTYDALGRRIGKGRLKTSQEVSDDLENQTRFVWDGSHMLQEIHLDGRYTYIYTDPDSYEPLAQIRDWTTKDGKKRQQTHYFHCDQIGIPREMTDKDGNLLWFGNYTGWGRLKEENKVTDSAYQPFRLQNQYADRETGLHYNFFRYYEPDAGRFVNQDPIGLMGGTNLYFFVPNIQTWHDQLGLRPKSFSGFASAEDAGRAALSKYNPMSLFLNREYGGIIFRNKNGTYGYTRGRLGTGRTAPSFNKCKNDLPKGAKPVGQYHTHGAYSDRDFNRTDKANDAWDSDSFSPADIKIHNGISRALENPNYLDVLGTPSKVFYKISGIVPGAGSAKKL